MVQRADNVDMQEQEQQDAPQVSDDQAQKDEQERQREQQQAAKLLECEKLFTQPDSIMEPGILDVLRRYLDLGGSAQNGADFLVDKYIGTFPCKELSCSLFPLYEHIAKPICLHVGYSQMASLVCSWIAKADQANGESSSSNQADEVTHMQVQLLHQVLFKLTNVCTCHEVLDLCPKRPSVSAESCFA